MTWRNPLFTPSSAVTGVRIAARSKSTKHDAMAVHLTLGRDVMTKLGFTVGEKVRLWVGDGPNAGWVRLTPPAGMDGTNLTVGTGGGGGRLAGGMVQFSARYLQGAAVVEKMTTIDAEHRVDRDGLDVKLPEGWVAAANAGAKRDKATYKSGEKIDKPLTPEKVADALDAERAAIEAAGLYSPPVEIEPEPAAALESGAVTNCKTGGNYAEAMPAVDQAPRKAKPPASSPTKFATRNPPPLGKREQPLRTMWSDDEVATLRRLWAAGASTANLLKALRPRPWSVIAYKASSLNLGVRPVVEKRGPDEATPKRPDPKPRVAVHAPAAADKPVKRVATVAEERRLPARLPAGAAAPSPEAVAARRALMDALKEPIGFLADAGVKVEPAMVAGMWFVDGEMITSRHLVQQANSLRAKAGLDQRYTLDDFTDRALSGGGGGSSLANMGA